MTSHFSYIGDTSQAPFTETIKRDVAKWKRAVKDAISNQLTKKVLAPSVAAMRASAHDVLSIAESHCGVDDTVVLALARKGESWHPQQAG